MTQPRGLNAAVRLCRTSSRVRVMCGHSPLHYGRSSHSLVNVHSKHSATTRSSTIAPAAVPVISWTLCSASQPTVPVRSTTSWSSVGTVSRSRGRASAKFTCSCSARTWATLRPRRVLMTPDCLQLLCRYRQPLRQTLNSVSVTNQLSLLTALQVGSNRILHCADFNRLNCTFYIQIYFLH